MSDPTAMVRERCYWPRVTVVLSLIRVSVVCLLMWFKSDDDTHRITYATPHSLLIALRFVCFADHGTRRKSCGHYRRASGSLHGRAVSHDTDISTHARAVLPPLYTRSRAVPTP